MAAGRSGGGVRWEARADSLMRKLVAARGPNSSTTRALLASDADTLRSRPDLARELRRVAAVSPPLALDLQTNPALRPVAEALAAQASRDQPEHAKALDAVIGVWGELVRVSPAEPTLRASIRARLVAALVEGEDAVVSSLGERPGYAAVLSELYHQDPEFRRDLSAPRLADVVDAIERHAAHELGSARVDLTQSQPSRSDYGLAF